MVDEKPKAVWAPFLHFYQPPVQEPFVLKEINNTCYEPLFNMLLENQEFKATFNVNMVLVDLLLDHGMDHTVDLLKSLVSQKQVEIVGSGKFHPILPLIPKNEVVHQIAMQEGDLKAEFPGWEKKGFFAPEMAISPGVASLIKELGYEWLIASGIACSSEWAYNKIYQSPEGLILYFRDDIISNEISFQKIDVESFLEKVKTLYSKPHYIITAQDGETFGHHVPHYERTFLMNALQGAIDGQITLCHVSDLPSYFPIDGAIRVISSSWSTSEEDLNYSMPYPLWNNPDNPIHRIQLKLMKNVLELVYFIEECNEAKDVKEAKTARYFLDRGLHSCQLWWASMRPMWSPMLIVKGAELLLRAAFNARLGIIDKAGDKTLLADSEELFDQTAQYYSLLLMEITKNEQVIQKKRPRESLFDSTFPMESDMNGKSTQPSNR
jgi:hypothetical protein